MLSEAQVEAFFVFLRKERRYAPSSMRLAIAALGSFYCDHLQTGKSWQLWQTLRVREPQSLPVVLSREEVAKILASVRRDRFRTILRLIYHTGLRIREACRLEVRDIDRASGRIHVREGKGGKDRYVPIAPAMIDDLARFWRRHHHPQWLFPGLRCDWKKGKEPAQVRAHQAQGPMSESSVQGAFRLALAQSGINKPATPHTLRHSYATHLLEEGVSIRLISAYLGHASLDVTVIYTHLTDCSESKACDALVRLHAQTCIHRPTSIHST
jgi:site-specific recombinase XerD